ncbi:MAG: DNA mismatch repair protein MutS [Anaerotignum sp.]|nr:DNA mismatch repair protein MutS [Anaerotignum sp.]
MAKITPMMQQYFEIKENYKHCLLFFRLGDFYEMFFEDAVIASKELEITLTGRDCGQEERAPMCGVPFHSADGYIARLVEKGYKIAICEQVEDPKVAKGLVKRDVVRVITPGTVVDNTVLDETKNNYILSVFSSNSGYGIAVCDVTTGEFQTTEFGSVQAAAKILDETARFSPAELICNTEFLSSPLAKEMEQRFHLYLNDIDSRMYDYNTAKDALLKHFKVKTLDGYGLKKKLLAVAASGALMWYLNETQKNDLSHISSLKYYTTGDFMLLDVSSRRNLELTETMREKNKKGSLLSVVDKTQTAMGARLLRKWVEQPLLSKEEINKRLDGVEELFNDLFLREEIKDILRSMYDFERIMSRVVYQNANARDLAALKNSIENLPLMKNILSRCKSPYLMELFDQLDPLVNIHELIEQSIVEDPPFSVREGGMIRSGFHDELDTYIKAKENGTAWIKQLEEEEKEKTGIKNLKIRYNKVFGYYIEITRSNLEQVPENYIRKQTLANAERFITPELKELEEIILGADDKITTLEYDLFCEIRNAVAAEVERIQYCAYIVSVIDCLQSLGEVAQSMHYVKPVVDDGDVIDIKGGRHPVVEKMMSSQFIPNDTYLDQDDTRLAIITGPNMAGKSTYMRQTALIVLMAQIGSFVPADEAHIGIVDRIFTRVGASDDLSAGQSTFMVEMTEVANILNNATNKSFVRYSQKKVKAI